MKSLVISAANGPKKASTGIAGFDEITGGGLPQGRTTLLVGGPGSGKTIFAMQFLVHGAAIGDEPGIFVAFEEQSDRIVANAKGFGWKLEELRQTKLFFIDAQPTPDLVLSGAFDLGGMLAVLEAKTSEMHGKRIVFDALDIVLAFMPDEAARRREVYRLHAWLLDHELTGLITAKTSGNVVSTDGDQRFGFMQFMVDCAVVLNHCVIQGVSQRNVRVQKYRGSGFDENESPFLIGSHGFEVLVARVVPHGFPHVTKERVSSGVERLDTMLGGGYYRGATVLITGLPGTAKTTMSGAFAEAACLRDEPTLFVSFDAESKEVIRDLESVGIRLAAHVERGMLRMISARSVAGSAESYLIRIKALAADMGARCVIIDPVSTWTKASDGMSAHSVADRLIDWCKSEGITLLCTSLLDELPHREEALSSLQISTLVDTWIRLDYLVQAGERNRDLTIIKSRGTAHSNQLCELILSDTGVTLSDIYTAGGEVLMGTMRSRSETADRVTTEAAVVTAEVSRMRLDADAAELEVRVKSLQTELAAIRAEKTLLGRVNVAQERDLSLKEDRMHQASGAAAGGSEEK